jgi:glycosyltransferase involved in cell wall biosynthesis
VIAFVRSADRVDPELMDSAEMAWPQAVSRASGEDVAVVRRAPRNGTVSRPGVHCRFVADRGEVSAWYRGRRMAEAVASLEPDVVHVDGMVCPLHVAQLRALLPARVALLVQDHGGPAGFERWLWRGVHRRGLRAADGFMFATTEQAAPWRKAGIISDEQPVYPILEGSTDLHELPARPGDPTAPGRPALLWGGRGDEECLMILDAVEMVAARISGVALTILGEALPEIEQRISSSRLLRDRVSLPGALERAALPSLYRSADIFLLGPDDGGLIEALSFGLIPVVADTPRLRALTEEGTLGAMFPAGDAVALADALERLATSDFGVQRASIRDFFARELSWPALGRRASDIYRMAAERRRLAPR